VAVQLILIGITLHLHPLSNMLLIADHHYHSY